MTEPSPISAPEPVEPMSEERLRELKRLRANERCLLGHQADELFGELRRSRAECRELLAAMNALADSDMKIIEGLRSECHELREKNGRPCLRKSAIALPAFQDTVLSQESAQQLEQNDWLEHPGEPVPESP